MTTMVSGKKTNEVETLIEETKTLLTGDEEPEVDLVEHGDMAALVGVRKFPARIKCATLAWHALEAALKGENEASTEQLNQPTIKFQPFRGDKIFHELLANKCDEKILKLIYL